MPFRLYVITNRKLAAPRALDDLIASALSGIAPGEVAVQLREKDLPAGELLDLARRIRNVTSRFGAQFLVNGNVDVAAVVGADGVHLPAGGMRPGDVRKAFPHALIGISTHSAAEAAAAAESGADFVVTGPVHPTSSKPGLTATMGNAGLSRVCSAVSIPVHALGGIDARNAAAAVRAGAAGVAVISSVMSAPNPAAAVRSLLRSVRPSR